MAALLALAGGGAAGCLGGEPPPDREGWPTESWQPGRTLPMPQVPNERGLLDLRGQIHAHSVYSHDACDGEPVKNGERDPACFDDFRTAVCRTRQDFVFLTDHPDSFRDNEFPDVLLFREERGDVLTERGTFGPVANRAGCGELAPGFTTLLMAGAESSAMMPVGVEGHALPLAERDAMGLYSDLENADTLKARGGVILVAHPEDHTLEELTHPAVDGFEMFNLHNLFMKQLVPAIDLALRFSEGDPSLPHPDLAPIRLFELDAVYMERWAHVVETGAHPTMTFGTDCHQNTLPGEATDGERIDSYRRMMSWMANHLLVEPAEDGTWDDVALKAALRAGRNYGVFEMLGTPARFDFHAESGAGLAEMGDEVALDDDLELVATRPEVRGRAPTLDEPDIRVSLLQHDGAGGWTEVAASTDGDVRYRPEAPGVFRVEVWMVPRHLEPWLGGDAYFVLQDEHAWVMSNPIYVR